MKSLLKRNQNLVVLLSLQCLLFTGTSGTFAQSVDSGASTPPTAQSEAGGTASLPGATLPVAASSPQIIDAALLSDKSSLILNSGSTTIIDFANSQSLNLTGAINNSGNLIFASSNPAISAASVSASGITNQFGATISSLLSSFAGPGLSGFYSLSNLSLSSTSDISNHGVFTSGGNLALSAVGQIINTGTIASQANLSMSTASLSNSGAISAVQNLNMQIANIVNQGQISATRGNLNVATNMASNIATNAVRDLIVNNAGGTFQALSGVINIRDSLYTGTDSLELNGGNIVARELNLNNGEGNIVAHLNSISGIVNTTGSCAALSVQDNNLSLGNLKISGDPTYFNTAGDIGINGNIQVGSSLAIIAAGNITTAAGVSLISTTNGAGQGSNIYIVSGANITGGTGSTGAIAATPPVLGNATSPVTIDMTPGTGGNIDFSASKNLVISSASTCPGCAGGNIVLAAFSDGAATGGQILMPGPTPGFSGASLVSSAASGPAGNVTVIAGASTGPGIVLGAIDTTGSGAAGTGLVRVNSAQPSSSNGLPIVFDVTGQISSNNSFTAGASKSSDVLFMDNVVASSITVSTGGNIRSVDAVVAQVLTGGVQPNAISINLAGTLVYAVDPVGGRLYRISTTTNTVLNSVVFDAVAGSLPLALAISPDGSRVYVADAAKNLVRVFDATTLVQIGPSIPVGANPVALAFDTNGSILYVANHNANNIQAIDTATLSVVRTIPTSGSPNSVIFNIADSTLYATQDNNNTLFGFDLLTNQAVAPVTLAAVPTSLGRCPCGTKLFAPSPQSGTLQGISLIGAALQHIPIAVGNQIDGIAITPNGSYAYVTNPTTGSVTIVQTLTATVKLDVPLAVNPTVTGEFAGFVGSNPVAYVPNGNQVAMIKTPVLLAPDILLTSGGSIEVAAGAKGASTNLSTSSKAATVVTSIGNLVSPGAVATAGSLQYATTGDITFNGNVTATSVDFHAMYGKFTNNATMSISGSGLTVASPNIINNGTMQLTGAISPRVVLQAPSGKLQLTFGGALAQISSISGSGTGLLDLNPAQGTNINVAGQGTLAADGANRVNGNPGFYAANIDIKTISGGFKTVANPSSISLQTQVGNITVLDSINTSSSTKSGGNIFVNAIGGALLTQQQAIPLPPQIDFNSDGFGPGNKAGNITLMSKSGLFLNGKITANGTGGAHGGVIVLRTSSNVDVCDCGPGGVTATALGGGNGGSVSISGKSLALNGLTPVFASVDVSSDQAAAGAVYVSSSDSVNTMVVGCNTCNGFAGKVLADGITGGRINLATASGFELRPGFVVSANGTTGAGGVAQILGVPGQTLNAQIDGTLNATNGALSSGVVGFNSYMEGGVNITGTTGSVSAGQTVALGNLDPATGLPINPLVFPASSNFQFGSIKANVGGNLIGNMISVGRLPPALPTESTATTRIAPPVLSFVAPSLLPNTTIIPIDQTPESLQTTVRVMDDGKLAANGGISAALAFTSDLGALMNQGIDVSRGPSDGSLVLRNGNVLFIAREPVTVITDLGKIQINPGNIVFVMAESGKVTAFNMHDEFHNSPIVSIGEKSSEFGLGQEIMLSVGHASFDEKIAHRQDELLYKDGGVELQSAQFSWTSAIGSISSLKAMRSSEPQFPQYATQTRKAIGQILKNAAVFSVVGSRFGPFR